MEFITTSSSTALTVMTTIIAAITTTPILALCLVSGTVLPIGIKLFHELGGKRG